MIVSLEVEFVGGAAEDSGPYFDPPLTKII